MSLKNCEQIKRQICDELSIRRLSASHDRWHLEHVLTFARQLHETHGGDMEVLTAAALLHDLGRSDSDLHGRGSVDKSVKEARKVLDVVDISPSKIEQVMLAISEHDQPELVPSTIEGKILKEADFLAGFGAWGVLRIAMWAVETQRGVDQIFDRLENRMRSRLENLELPQSDWRANKDILFADLFVSRLKQPPVLEESLPGKYIVLEGISGSGKDTQANLLVPRLEHFGHKVLKVHEPSGKFQHARDDWGPKPLDPVIELFLVLADRYELVTQRVVPALARGETVVSVRSYISSLVYQRQPLYDAAAIRFMHHFVPPLDLLILYDVDAHMAHARCYSRAAGARGDATMGAHEQLGALETHRRRYLDVVGQLAAVASVVIDASRSAADIARETWQVVKARSL